ncbi:MAG: hypothetical protein HRU38_03510 [Saccharospirillaceae bacterium]|nr:hypothetical protein [Pseudomonadales bacterium]NRB77730.1 hypothetical protein [Saccharospirillaceae bacterium]
MKKWFILIIIVIAPSCIGNDKQIKYKVYEAEIELTSISQIIKVKEVVLGVSKRNGLNYKVKNYSESVGSINADNDFMSVSIKYDFHFNSFLIFIREINEKKLDINQNTFIKVRDDLYFNLRKEFELHEKKICFAGGKYCGDDLFHVLDIMKENSNFKIEFLYTIKGLSEIRKM